MNKITMITAAALSALVLTGCASSGLSDEETAIVGPWYDMACVFKDAQDPVLNAPINTQIKTLDAASNTLGAIAKTISELTVAYIRDAYASTAWNTYVAWANGPEANKFSAEELAAAALDQAKLACFEQGVAMNSTDPLVDAKRVITFRQLNRADASAVKAFLDANTTEQQTAWAKALVDATGKERAIFYSAIGVKEMNMAETTEILNGLTEKLNVAINDLSMAMQDAELVASLAKAAFGGEVVPGVSGEVTKKELGRLTDQMALCGRLLPWLIDAIATAE